MKIIHSCKCGGIKFYCTYSKAYCAVCNSLQPGILAENILVIYSEAPDIEDVCILSTTD